MVSKSCIFAALLVKYIAALTNIDDEVAANGGNPGDWWYDDFVYVADGGYVPPSTNANAWYNGYDPDSALDETVTCSICTADPQQSPTKKIWGWYESVAGQTSSYRIQRDFQCNSVSTVTYRITMYWCTQQTDAEFYINDKFAPGGLLYTYLSGAGTQIGTGADMRADASTVEASDPCRELTITNSMIVEPGDIFSLGIGSQTQNDATGWNRFRIRCVQEITGSPSTSPTSTTEAPTVPPTPSPTPAPTDDPTPAPTDDPTESPITAQPTESPITRSPSNNPTVDPTIEPTQQPTYDPTENPTPRPTEDGTPAPTTAPTEAESIADLFSKAFGGGGDCTDGWIACNTVVFIILSVSGVSFLVYWIFGCVWYVYRQKNRPVPAHMLVGANGGTAVGQTSVEMNTTGAAQHATSDRWKSAWEIEQEQKRAAEAQAAAGGPGQDGMGYGADTGNQGGW